MSIQYFAGGRSLSRRTLLGPGFGSGQPTFCRSPPTRWRVFKVGPRKPSCSQPLAARRVGPLLCLRRLVLPQCARGLLVRAAHSQHCLEALRVALSRPFSLPRSGRRFPAGLAGRPPCGRRRAAIVQRGALSSPPPVSALRRGWVLPASCAIPGGRCTFIAKRDLGSDRSLGMVLTFVDTSCVFHFLMVD